jgi:hypothetical protein
VKVFKLKDGHIAIVNEDVNIEGAEYIDKETAQEYFKEHPEQGKELSELFDEILAMVGIRRTPPTPVTIEGEMIQE